MKRSEADSERLLHAYLKRHFIALEDGDEVRMLDPDGRYAFVVCAFVKPSNPKEYAGEASRGDRAAAVGTALMAVSPEAVPDEEGSVSHIDAMQAGIHVVASMVMAKLLSSHAMGYVVQEAQRMVFEKEERLNA